MVQPVEAHPQTLQPHNGLREALTSLRSQGTVRIRIRMQSTLGNSNSVANQIKFHVSP